MGKIKEEHATAISSLTNQHNNAMAKIKQETATAAKEEFNRAASLRRDELNKQRQDNIILFS